jgi:uncharacterized protein with NRDE domain
VCTLALYFRILDDYPLLVGANRDEHYDRPSAAPTLHGSQPIILAGTDLQAGGTWLGVNDCGLLVGILNRRSTGEPSVPTQTRSRGLLCLDLLGLKSAAEARAFVQLREETYQPFTILFADPNEAWTAYNVERQIKIIGLDPGLHVFSNTAEFSTQSEKRDRADRQFSELLDDFRLNRHNPSRWIPLLAQALGDHALGSESVDPREAICVHGDISGTVSSGIVFYSVTERRFYSSYSPGPPCRTPFDKAITLGVR